MRNIKAILRVAAVLGGLLATSGTALADSHGGTISLYHLNSAIAGRGVCIQTTPALPGTWACLWKSNPLYQEITTLLLNGFVFKRYCTISWTSMDSSGFPIIDLAECSS